MAKFVGYDYKVVYAAGKGECGGKCTVTTLDDYLITLLSHAGEWLKAELPRYVWRNDGQLCCHMLESPLQFAFAEWLKAELPRYVWGAMMANFIPMMATSHSYDANLMTCMCGAMTWYRAT